MATKPMGIGVIGAGAISDIYLQNMIHQFPQLEVVCICAKHLESAQKKAEKYGIPACTTQELLADPRVDLVVVLTPVETHYSLIKQALLAGKHVYTEKTLTDQVETAAELLQLVEEKELCLCAAPDTFFGSAQQTARKAIDSGLIGKVHSFTISANRNNDMLLSIFSFLRQPGAGILNDYGVYYLTALVHLLGPIRRVGGVIGTPYPTHVNIFPMSPDFGKVMDTPNESQVSAVIQLENGITGTFHMNADSNLRDEAFFAIYGTKGILYATDPNQFGGTIRYLPNALDPRVPVQPIDLWSYAQYGENSRGVGVADMVDAIRENRPCRASSKLAYHVLEALAGILNGGENGCFVDIHSSCAQPEVLPTASIGSKNLGHASFNMKNAEAMLHFYGQILGMKQQFSLNFGHLIPLLEAQLDPQSEEFKRIRAGMESMAQMPWLTYMKLGEGQFIELFYPSRQMVRQIENRRANYGYTKLNFEVASIEAIRDRMVAHGVHLDEDIHPTLDGALEITVHDPDGNEVQFTQYPTGDQVRIPMPPVCEGHSCSQVNYITQVAYQVKDAANMEFFYRFGLGLKKVMTLTYGQLAAAMEASGNADPKMLMGMKRMGDQAWIDYIEVAPHQYIELFYTPGQSLEEDRNLQDAYGYQHICIEVADIQAAWKAVTANGLVPDGPVQLGPDGAYQFWLTDPDGNRLELMQYSENALQIQPVA